MREALVQAQMANEHGEVPVGAVLVRKGEIIGRGRSCQIETYDPSAHAEVVALRNAGRCVGNYRLVDSTLYVTLEPCMMCTGLLVHARIKRLVYGCQAPKTGVVHTHGNLLEWPLHNHVVQVHGGVLAMECSALLSEFFELRRGDL